MKLTFENLGTNTYLVYEINDTDELDSMSLGMLTNNHISGFAPVSFTQMDMTKYIKYNVSAKVSVSQLFSGPVNKKRLVGVFLGIVEAMLAAEEYMLDANTILLDTDYIFTDVTTCATEVICLPIMNLEQKSTSLEMFLKNILFTTQFDQTENCDHVAQLINYLNTHPVLLLEEFKELLHTLSHGSAVPASVAPVQQPVQSTSQPAAKAPAQQAPQTAAQAPVQQAPQPAPVQPVANKPVPPAKPSVQPVQKKPNPAPHVPGMQIPGVPAPNNAPAAPVRKNGEKPMTLMYLMQHYNKENAAIYKAQQEAKKAKGTTPVAPQQSKPAPKKPTPPANASFAVPGKQPGFAIPGQAQPAVQPMTQQAQPAPQPMQPAPQPAPQSVQPAPQPAPQPVPHATASVPLNFGETTVLSAGVGETTVLSAATQAVKNDPHLIRTKNNEKIPLNKPVFRVGKERSYVDYFISDNTAVSRSHANIIDHNGEFFVVDTNSTNHTYVNGGMIQSGVETKLSHGTKIRFANEDFEFRMY